MSGAPALHIALIHPEIGPNAGNAGRLCLGLGARLHLVHPLGFQTDDKAVRRAGLDYWRHVDVVEHDSLEAFLESMAGVRLHLFSSHGARRYTAPTYAPGDALVFGRESVGLPADLVSAHGGGLLIPMVGPTRSLNLSNAVAVAAYRAMQDIAPAEFA
jgi:tRNA (cytidine/uridine-2'-O-)-methyltransferase